MVVLSLLALAAVAGAVPASAQNPTETVTVSQAPAPVTAGLTVGYTTTFTSTRILNSLRVKDPIPAGMTYVSATPSLGSCTAGSKAVTCDIGFLAAGDTASVLFVFQTPSTPTTLTNKVSWTGTSCGYHPCDVKVTRKSTTSVVAPSPDLVAQYVLPEGATIATGTKVTKNHPLATSADIPETPLGTPVTINQVNATGPGDACGPAADCFGKISEITVGTTFTPGGPMTFVFTVDGSQVPYGSLLPLYHDGVLVPDCTGGSGEASPDPCVASRTYVPGTNDPVFTVYSSTNGRWRP